MKTLCNRRTSNEQLRVCKGIVIVMLIAVVLLAGVTLYDYCTGEAVSGTRITLLCADVTILCSQIINMRRLRENCEEAKDQEVE